MKNEALAIITRIFNFLSGITSPVPIADFTALESTGDPAVDNLLSQTSLIYLKFLKEDGSVIADDLSKNDAKIYGLTEKGVQTFQLFLTLQN